MSPNANPYPENVGKLESLLDHTRTMRHKRAEMQVSLNASRAKHSLQTQVNGSPAID